MTLILTVCCRSFVAQVVDRRLTLPDGTLYDDHVTKLVCLESVEAIMSIAYTGLALLGPGLTQTDEWIVQALGELRAAELPLVDMIPGLASRVQVALERTPCDKSAKGLTLVLAGLRRDGIPFLCWISNMKRADGSDLAVPAKTVSHGVRLPKPDVPPQEWFLANSEGDVGAVPQAAVRAVRRLREVCRREDACGKGIVRALGQLVYWTAETHSAGRISKQSLATLLDASGIETMEYPDPPDGCHRLPHLVGRAMEFMDVEVKAGDEWLREYPPINEWPDLRAEIDYRYNPTHRTWTFRVSNLGSLRWDRVRLDLNGGPREWTDIPKGFWWSNGYIYRWPGLPPGGVIEIPARALRRPGGPGSRFDALRMRPTTAAITARLPDGEYAKYMHTW